MKLYFTSYSKKSLNTHNTYCNDDINELPFDLSQCLMHSMKEILNYSEHKLENENKNYWCFCG